MLALVAADQESLAVVLERARQARAQLPGLPVVYRQDFYQLASGRTSFGYKDGIGNPAIEGSGAAVLPGQGPALKAGEFVLGYPDQTGNLPPMQAPCPCWAGTVRSWPGGSFTRASLPSESISTTIPAIRTKRRCSLPRSWAAGRAAPR